MFKSEIPRKNWHPSKIIDKSVLNDNSDKYALLVLNRPINIDPNHTLLLWKNAAVRILVDGGANRWMTFLQNTCQSSVDLKPPDLVTGDFDSITKKALESFFQSGSKIVETPDQNETDFTKALIELKPHIQQKQINRVIVLYDMSGRIDHIMGTINTLCKAQTILEGVDVHIICQSSIYWLLGEGEHCISIPREFINQQLWCALVPMSGKTLVSSTGLKWNLNDSILEFGGLVSTSNTYATDADHVTIKTNKSLLWSMGISKDDDD